MVESLDRLLAELPESTITDPSAQLAIWQLACMESWISLNCPSTDEVQADVYQWFAWYTSQNTARWFRRSYVNTTIDRIGDKAPSLRDFFTL